jgi:hypothetical protein
MLFSMVTLLSLVPAMPFVSASTSVVVDGGDGGVRVEAAAPSSDRRREGSASGGKEVLSGRSGAESGVSTKVSGNATVKAEVRAEANGKKAELRTESGDMRAHPVVRTESLSEKKEFPESDGVPPIEKVLEDGVSAGPPPEAGVRDVAPPPREASSFAGSIKAFLRRAFDWFR